ncbi:type II secretion system F family protein [Actinomyces ruminicola]|uniref:Tight adherence protein C n=1 Tax=Actinomyces ruminicola TaxID=332524 RepID=A0A1G9YLK9_9ACTO|nr:type II secretion system F family protein [Actinomyces ruminicola]SDN10109.1 tight adherence protein C [Actinomyces ruminicola]
MAALFGMLAACMVLLGAQGVRMVRASLVEDLLATGDQAAEETAQRTGPFTRIVDLLGRMTQSMLLDLYGAERIKRLAWQLRAAGQPAEVTAQTFIQREAGFASLGLVLMVLAALNGQTFMGVVLGVLFVCWMHAWLLLTLRRRQEQIERDLPDFLDVFAVTVSAGLPFRVALQRVAEQHSGALAEEMRLTLREMQLGVPRRQALEGLRERTRSENVSSFVTALLQSEELGTPLEEALRQISKEVRRERGQQVRRQAAKSQPKVSLVVTTCIIPGAIVLIVGGMLVSNLDAITGLFNG